MVCDLSGLGDEPARLLGALIVSQFAQAAESRADEAEASRRDYTLVIDELQNFASLAFSRIVSEARKWRLSIVLAHQYVGQIAVMGPPKPCLATAGRSPHFVLVPKIRLS